MLRVISLLIVGFVLASSVSSAVFNGTNVGAIPDGGSGTPPQCGTPRDVAFNVTGFPAVGSAAVSFTMTHGYIGDLQISLTAPDATSMVIMSRVGADTATSFGDSSNMSGAYVFSDIGAGGIWAAAAGVGNNENVPAATYRTQSAGPFSPINPGPAFTNMNATFGGVGIPNGTWILRFRDCAAADTGTVTAATLTLFGPLAGEASVSGRVTTAKGNGIRNAVVQISGGNLAEPIYTRTGESGSYRFEVPAGQTYIVSVSSKRFYFEEPVRLVTVGDSVADFNFVAVPY